MPSSGRRRRTLGFQRYHSQPVQRVETVNPILRGWVNYFAIGYLHRCFHFVERWVEIKVRRHLLRARKRRGLAWERWSTQWLHATMGLFNSYRVRLICGKSSQLDRSHNP